MISKYFAIKTGNGPKQQNYNDSGVVVLHSIAKILENEQTIKKFKNTTTDWWGTITSRESLLSIIKEHHYEYLAINPQ